MGQQTAFYSTHLFTRSNALRKYTSVETADTFKRFVNGSFSGIESIIS